MKTVRLCLAAILIIAALPADAGEALSIAATVKPIFDKSSGWSIESTITNLEEKPIVVADAYLPWGNRYAMLVAGFAERRPNKALALGYPVDDPLFNRTTIPAKASIKGSIPLSNYLPGAAEAMKSGKVIVLWAFQMTSDDGRTSERFAGTFVLPPN